MTTTQSRTLLGLADVAALAEVQRAVVSMWRTRSAHTDTPFPSAVTTDGGQEWFGLDDVVTWLEATGRGNNPHVREDGTLHATLDLGLPSGIVLDGITALLALKAVIGEQLAALPGSLILDHADDVDPHDHYLYREVLALGEDLPMVAAHVDAMASAGYAPTAALEAVMAQRFRNGLQGDARTALAPAALDLVGSLAAEIVGLGGRPTAVVDPSGGSDLLAAVRSRFELPDLPEAALGGGDGVGARLARRRLLAHGWPVTQAPTDHDGRLVLPPHAVVIAQLPSSALPEMSDGDILDAIDEIALAMDDSHTAVVIGPSGALVDRPATAAVERARDALLRTHRVRAVVRLPSGLRTAHPRERLGMWVLGPAHADVPIADRWLALADLATPLDAVATGDLVTDVLASLGPAATVRSHAFRFARLARTSRVIAASGALVARLRPRMPVDRATGAADAARITSLLATVREPVPAVDVMAGVVARTGGTAHIVTLGELIDERVVRVVGGNRIDAADLHTAGDVRVIGPDDVRGGTAPRFVDRLTFSSRYPSGRYTEPGDVVVTTSGTPGAMVDDAGLAVVVSPARVLRLDRDRAPGLVPAVVVRATRGATPGTPWRSWPIPLVDDGSAAVLAAALADVAAARAATQARLQVLDELTGRLSDGVTAGRVGLTPLETQEG